MASVRGLYLTRVSHHFVPAADCRPYTAPLGSMKWEHTKVLELRLSRQNVRELFGRQKGHGWLSATTVEQSGSSTSNRSRSGGSGTVAAATRAGSTVHGFVDGTGGWREV